MNCPECNTLAETPHGKKSSSWNERMLTGEGSDVRYQAIFGDVSRIVNAARRSAARSANSVMTAAYWMIGRRIVEFEQSGEKRAEYGTALIERLSTDLWKRFGRGFGSVNLSQMKKFYLLWSVSRILQTVSEKSEDGESSSKRPAKPSLAILATRFPLPWSAYVRLLSVKNIHAREFYETEALRGGWTVHQLKQKVRAATPEKAKSRTAHPFD